jgi:hypothetical protein
MGRTMPSRRVVVEEEIARMARFKQFLRTEERAVFHDLLAQCRLYASAAGALASPVKEVPLLLSIIFAQHRRLTELETREQTPTVKLMVRVQATPPSRGNRASETPGWQC